MDIAERVEMLCRLETAEAWLRSVVWNAHCHGLADDCDGEPA